MKKLILLVVGLVMVSCSVTHPISETPTSTRQALIYDDKVVIVTRTTMTLEQYYTAVSNTRNKEN
jgi:uncharacterized protein YcfL